MSRKMKKQTDSDKLDQILAVVTTVNEKVDSQNKRIENLQKEVRNLEYLVNEMAKKHRMRSLIAGGIGGGMVAVGFELIRLKLGG